MNNKEIRPLEGSFRDPGGFVFENEGRFYRQINKSALKDFDKFNRSKLKDVLEKKGLILGYKEVKNKPNSKQGYKIIEPQQLPFITYPYEWCFSQLKEAAILTLEIVLESLEFNMILKDANPYNIQMTEQGLKHIDTLSFSTYKKGHPWIAYKQYCETFLAPLLMMAYVDKSLNKLLITNIEGIPLNLVTKTVPWSKKLSVGYLIHIKAHERIQEFGQRKEIKTSKNTNRMPKESLIKFIKNLENYTKNIKPKDSKSFWEGYYEDNNYTKGTMKKKSNIVEKWIKSIKPKTIWDLGTNTGKFAEVGARYAERVIALDVDHQSIEKLYRKREHLNIYPLVIDITNPSPAIGWENKERKSLEERGPADLILSLALVHHLAISNNTPLEKVAEMHRNLARNIIIEFIPKEDTQVQRLLRTREDIFKEYNQRRFEEVFKRYFEIEEKYKIPNTKRILYRMQEK